MALSTWSLHRRRATGCVRPAHCRRAPRCSTIGAGPPPPETCSVCDGYYRDTGSGVPTGFGSGTCSRSCPLKARRWPVDSECRSLRSRGSSMALRRSTRPWRPPPRAHMSQPLRRSVTRATRQRVQPAPRPGACGQLGTRASLLWETPAVAGVRRRSSYSRRSGRDPGRRQRPMSAGAGALSSPA